MDANKVAQLALERLRLAGQRSDAFDLLANDTKPARSAAIVRGRRVMRWSWPG
jgi:hypothetical protein